jgi:hypothetical protein
MFHQQPSDLPTLQEKSSDQGWQLTLGSEQHKGRDPLHAIVRIAHTISTALHAARLLCRSYLMALDRSEACSKKYTSEAACMADSRNRCFWSKVDNRGICLSADYAEVSSSAAAASGWEVSGTPCAMLDAAAAQYQFSAWQASAAHHVLQQLRSGCWPASQPASQPLFTNPLITAVVYCILLLQVTAFERSGFLVDLATLPSSMTCPGSKAREFFSCYAHPAPGETHTMQSYSVHAWWRQLPPSALRVVS